MHTAEKGVPLSVCSVGQLLCTSILHIKLGKKNSVSPFLCFPELSHITALKNKNAVVEMELEEKTNPDTYPMLYCFCSMGSFLFCIIMSKNVNNGHKVYFLPRCICKWQTHGSKNDYWNILTVSPPSNKGDFIRLNQQLRQVNVSQNHRSVKTTGWSYP